MKKKSMNRGARTIMGALVTAAATVTTPAWARLVEVDGPFPGRDALQTEYDLVFEVTQHEPCTASARLVETPAADLLYLTCPVRIASEAEFAAAGITPAVAAPRQPADWISAEFEAFELVTAPPEVTDVDGIVTQTSRDESKLTAGVWSTLSCRVGAEQCSTAFLRAQAALIRYPRFLRARLKWTRSRPIEPICYPNPVCPGSGGGFYGRN